MRRLSCWTLFALFAASSPLAAQIFEMPGTGQPSPPGWWISGGGGWLIAPTVLDGSTGAGWNFGDGIQYRFSVEKQVSAGTSLGLAVSHARVPLTWTTLAGAPASTVCPVACDAEADVQSLIAMFRGGDRPGFHQILELMAGVTRYGNFRADTGDDLPPDGFDTDFTYSVAYGFGYGLSMRSSITLVQDYTSVMHQRAGLAGGSGRTSHQHITRLAFRLGF